MDNDSYKDPQSGIQYSGKCNSNGKYCSNAGTTD